MGKTSRRRNTKRNTKRETRKQQIGRLNQKRSRRSRINRSRTSRRIKGEKGIIGRNTRRINRNRSNRRRNTRRINRKRSDRKRSNRKRSNRRRNTRRNRISLKGGTYFGMMHAVEGRKYVGRTVSEVPISPNGVPTKFYYAMQVYKSLSHMLSNIDGYNLWLFMIPIESDGVWTFETCVKAFDSDMRAVGETVWTGNCFIYDKGPLVDSDLSLHVQSDNNIHHEEQVITCMNRPSIYERVWSSLSGETVPEFIKIWIRRTDPAAAGDVSDAYHFITPSYVEFFQSSTDEQGKFELKNLDIDTLYEGERGVEIMTQLSEQGLDPAPIFRKDEDELIQRKVVAMDPLQPQPIHLEAESDGTQLTELQQKAEDGELAGPEKKNLIVNISEVFTNVSSMNKVIRAFALSPTIAAPAEPEPEPEPVEAPAIGASHVVIDPSSLPSIDTSATEWPNDEGSKTSVEFNGATVNLCDFVNHPEFLKIDINTFINGLPSECGNRTKDFIIRTFLEKKEVEALKADLFRD